MPVERFPLRLENRVLVTSVGRANDERRLVDQVDTDNYFGNARFHSTGEYSMGSLHSTAFLNRTSSFHNSLIITTNVYIWCRVTRRMIFKRN